MAVMHAAPDRTRAYLPVPNRTADRLAGRSERSIAGGRGRQIESQATAAQIDRAFGTGRRGAGGKTVEHGLAVPGGLYQARVPQDLQVMGEEALLDPEGRVD